MAEIVEPAVRKAVRVTIGPECLLSVHMVEMGPGLRREDESGFVPAIARQRFERCPHLELLPESINGEIGERNHAAAADSSRPFQEIASAVLILPPFRLSECMIHPK